MDHQKIIELLNEIHQALFDFLAYQDDEKWEKGPENKWTTGQHVLHLIQSIKPLRKASKLPKFILAYKFGLNNRDSREYEVIKYKYKSKLADNQGVVSPFSQNMPKVLFTEKTKLINELCKENKKLQNVISKWKQHQSIQYLLPHPLLGKMTVNEIWIWTAIHTEHHLAILKNKYP